MTSHLFQATCVALGPRSVLFSGPPGSGKSSLALALIDRGAVLVGDDGVLLEAIGGRLAASPAPATEGLLEVRNVGLLRFPVVRAVPVALMVALDPDAPRYIDQARSIDLFGQTVPLVQLWPDTPALALRTEAALRTWGLD